MSKLLTTLRTHWKKSLFFSGLASYGAYRGAVKRQEDLLMTGLCREAAAFGRQEAAPSAPLYKVTVVLNPAADGGRARKKYEKYCAPILHLAGLKVHVVRTEGEGQAKQLLELLSAEGAPDGRLPDAVLVAGGDGTVMEAATGYLRRPDAARIRARMPLGVLPVGAQNRLAKSLFPEVSTSVSDVELMARSALSCVRQVRRPMDVMQVENISEGEEYSGKKIYGMSEVNKDNFPPKNRKNVSSVFFFIFQVQLGAFRDAHDRLSKYWYWAGLKKVMAYAFGFTTAAKMHLWNCECDLEYAVPAPIPEPSEAVVAVEEEKRQSSSWWHFFFPPSAPSRANQPGGDQSREAQRPRREWRRLSGFRGIEIAVSTPNVRPLVPRLEEEGEDDGRGSEGRLDVVLGPEELGFSDFVGEGWRRERGESSPLHCTSRQKAEDSLEGQEDQAWRRIKTQSLRLFPGFEKTEEEKERYFYLDRESVEVKGPIELTLLPKKLVMFCSQACQAEVLPDDESLSSRLNQKWWQKSSGGLSSRTSTPLGAAARRL